jgi:hypothetical protein
VDGKIHRTGSRYLVPTSEALTQDSMGSDLSIACIVNIQLKITSINTQETVYRVISKENHLGLLSLSQPSKLVNFDRIASRSESLALGCWPSTELDDRLRRR